MALQKKGGGGFRTEAIEFQLNSVVLNGEVLGGFPTLRRTLFKPLRDLALLLIFLRVIKFLSTLSLPISPPGRYWFGGRLWYSAGAFQIAAAVLALWAWCCSRVQDSMRVKGSTFKCRVDPTLASQGGFFRRRR